MGVESGCDFFPLPACAGVAVEPPAAITLVPDTGGAWETLSSTVSPPDGMASAQCGVIIERRSADTFQLFLDDAVLSGRIFADGFESAWSAVVP